MRVKLIKDYKDKSEGTILEVSPNEGFGLIDSGYAILTKDITKKDIQTKALDEGQANGNTTKLRSHNKS